MGECSNPVQNLTTGTQNALCVHCGYAIHRIEGGEWEHTDKEAVVLDDCTTERERRLWWALYEVDLYLAADPELWRYTAAAKAGDVLCDVLGGDVIGSINDFHKGA